eukprot:gene9102-11154_t
MESTEGVQNRPLFRVTKTPQFPVIYEDPTPKQIISNLRTSDHIVSLGVPTLLTTAYYYSTYRHGRSAAMWLTLFVPACYFVSYTHSQNRLTGMKDNEKECKNHKVEFQKKPSPFSF